jgi:metal-responsive CopG/Arc/MetJ family transcriptional regulator
MSTTRITITLPRELVERVDRVATNRSRFIAAAMEAELRRRTRVELRRSLDEPHVESVEMAETGLTEFRATLPDDAAELVDSTAGVAVRWVDGEGWTRGETG